MKGERSATMSINLDAAANMLFSMEPMRKPITQAIISSSNLPEGGHGLDVGCGIGLQTLLLAQAAGMNGHVAGVDISTSFLGIAQELAQQAGMADHVSFQPGSWDQIPYEKSTFDWVWSMDAACYAPHEPVSTIHELARVIKPGGRLILGYWSSQTLLPGYPALEARFNATPAGIAPFLNDSRPDAHFLNTLNWMQQAGVVNTYAETFVQTVCAPLTPDLRQALTELFAMRWGTVERDVSAEDWQAYLDLCRAESPEYILDRSGYYAFFTYSVFYGSIPGR
jgi:ubiquinone/menaquinone biosynthesis C-methylase UbiE